VRFAPLLLLLLAAPPFAARAAAPADPPTRPERPAPVVPAPEIRWHPFGPEALRAARASGRPILLTVTTPWCHLCRVMDATTFADPDVRRLVHETVVPARLDGERRPDLNERYNLGGWPTTIFLVGDGEPLLYPRGEARPADAPSDGTEAITIAKVGSTFLSAGELKALLLATGKYFRDNRPSLVTLYKKIDAVRAEEQRRPSPDLVAPDAAAAEEASNRIADALYADFDPEQGGFGDPPGFAEKFPFPEGIAFALARASRGDGRFRDVAEATITGLARGALRDPLAGGFYRGSRSRDWRLPHYEKLLGVNAAILEVLSEASAAGVARGNAAPAAAQTLAWIRATLALPGSPLLGSAQDSQTTRAGKVLEEGTAYTWTRGEIARALAPMGAEERAMVIAHFGFDRVPEGEGGSARRPLWIAQDAPRLAARMKSPLPRVEAALKRGTSLLASARAARPAPEIFRTAYTDSNARAASAFLAAAGALGKPGADAPAIAILAALWKERWAGAAGVRHEGGEGGAPAGGLLRDHVALLAAALDAYEASGERVWLDRAQEIAAVTEKRFLDARHGTYLDVAPIERGPGVPSPLTRGRALLSENAGAALALTRLAEHTGAHAPRARAETLLAWCLTQAASYGRHAAEVGLALEQIRRPPLVIAVWARPGAQERRAMLLAARGIYDPGRLILPLDPARDAAVPARLGAAPPPDPSILICRAKAGKMPVDAAGVRSAACAPPICPGRDLAAAMRRAAASFDP